jgi:predicted deacylase
MIDMLDKIKPGSKVIKKFKIAENADRSSLKLPMIIIKGKEEGPVLLLNAAVHGNELIGVEIIRRFMEKLGPKDIKGTLIGVPIVNIPAYNSGQRMDPLDQKDMNREFPGHPHGSIIQRLAHFFYTEIVMLADYIIDFHSAEYPDIMLPHIRVRTKDPTGKSQLLCQAYSPEIVWEGEEVKGMLQVCAVKAGKAAITVEIGAASVLEEKEVEAGIKGIKNVMTVLGMLGGTADILDYQIYIKSNEQWRRSPHGGIFRPFVELGGIVKKGQVLGEIADPFNLKVEQIKAESSGLVAGIKISPVVRTGTRLFFILPPKEVENGLEEMNLIRVPELPNSRYSENRILQKVKRQ